MPSTNPQKAKLLFLTEMLRQDSDEHHPLTTRQLQSRLEQKGISCDRRTLSGDMQDLNALGFEVMSRMVGHEKGYYMAERSFSVPELRILMDAVQAAGFIPPDKTQVLAGKIAALGGSHQAGLLRRNTILFNGRKHTNSRIFYTVDTLENALSAGKQVRFRYFDLNENREKIYRRDGQFYCAEPLGMVLVQDSYYLTALSPDRPGISRYRVDRMDSVTLSEEPVSEQVEQARRQLPELTRDSFKMFAGKAEIVTLVFSDKLTGYVFDQFGENARVTRLDDTRCRARVRVQISPTFFGWLFQFGGQMVLLEPARVVQQVKNYIAGLPYIQSAENTVVNGNIMKF